MGGRQRHWPRITRDLVLFTAGLAGIAHETLAPSSSTPALLVAFMAMVGLPTMLRYDFARQREDRQPMPPQDEDPWEWRRRQLEQRDDKRQGYWRR